MSIRLRKRTALVSLAWVVRIVRMIRWGEENSKQFVNF